MKIPKLKVISRVNPKSEIYLLAKSEDERRYFWIVDRKRKMYLPDEDIEVYSKFVTGTYEFYSMPEEEEAKLLKELESFVVFEAVGKRPEN